jgi:cobalamin biosynthesis protein CbiG
MPLEFPPRHSDGSPYSAPTNGVPTRADKQAPRNTGRLIVGIGCRRGIAAEAIDAAIRTALNGLGSDRWNGPMASTIGLLASIDAKASEPGLLAFAEQHGIALQFFSAEALATASAAVSAAAAPQTRAAFPSKPAPDARRAMPPSLPSSGAVRRRFGIDHVCEAAARTACPTGNVLLPKTIFGDITLSIVGPISP